MSELKIPVKRVMLIDDEPAAINHLRSVIDTFDELEIIAEIGDGRRAIKEIIKQEPDIVFLDIEMPEVTGFEVAKATADVSYQLVFVTAYDHYALEAFDTKAIDYLLKPVRPSVFKKCINKILHQEDMALEALEEQKGQSDSLVLSDGKVMRVVNQRHITYIEGIGRYRCIHLNQAGIGLHRMPTIVSGTTLDDFESQLSTSAFTRLHRSFIVSIEQIVDISVESRRHYVSLMESDMKIPVARAKVSELKSALKYGTVIPNNLVK